MTLFIEAGAPLKGGPTTHCEGGKERTEQGLARAGLQMGAIVTMRDALEIVGLSDTVFSLPYVVKQSQSEARTVLLKYMAYQLDIIKTLLPVLSISKYAEYMKAVDKRTLGHNRPALLALAHETFVRLWREELDHTNRYALAALVVLASSAEDNIAACHAGINLMDAGRSAGRGEQIRHQLEQKMRELIPISPQDIWDKMPKGEI